MGFFNSNEPFWLPPGSIRALLVMILNGSLVYALIFALHNPDKEVGELAKLVFVGILPFAIDSVRQYFASKNGHGKEPPVTP